MVPPISLRLLKFVAFVITLHCITCGQQQTMNHIFNSCPLSKFEDGLWSVFTKLCWWGSPQLEYYIYGDSSLYSTFDGISRNCSEVKDHGTTSYGSLTVCPRTTGTARRYNYVTGWNRIGPAQVEVKVIQWSHQWAEGIWWGVSGPTLRRWMAWHSWDTWNIQDHRLGSRTVSRHGWTPLCYIITLQWREIMPAGKLIGLLRSQQIRIKSNTLKLDEVDQGQKISFLGHNSLIASWRLCILYIGLYSLLCTIYIIFTDKMFSCRRDTARRSVLLLCHSWEEWGLLAPRILGFLHCNVCHRCKSLASVWFCVNSKMKIKG